ncbi:hypothetical protein C8R42DRAFT_714577 [Lentinula raphanica]|nr:hypothetical protein C8R42DRAFT_714577 [Lentinula raphanica]
MPSKLRAAVVVAIQLVVIQRDRPDQGIDRRAKEKSTCSIQIILTALSQQNSFYLNVGGLVLATEVGLSSKVCAQLEYISYATKLRRMRFNDIFFGPKEIRYSKMKKRPAGIFWQMLATSGVPLTYESQLTMQSEEND